ncbi:MAG: tyrosine-type recombinase/integrase [Acidimicrobiia bacterium]
MPTEDELRRWYETVWQARRGPDIVLIKTLLYTGVRVSELVALRLDDVDLDECRIRVRNGKAGKDPGAPRSCQRSRTWRKRLGAQICTGSSSSTAPRSTPPASLSGR